HVSVASGDGHLGANVARIVDLLAVHLDDDVARLEVLLGGGAVLGNLGDHGALGFGQADRLCDVVAHILDHDAKPAAVNRAGGLELAHDFLNQRRGHGEGDAHTAAGGREDGGVDAN